MSTTRILLCLIFNVFPVLTTVPWDYPNLSNKDVTTSPFTIVFKQFGSSALTFYPLLAPIFVFIFFAVASASFMNTVILSSAISAGNHALFAGTRVLYGLAQASQAPSLFAWTTRRGVPLPALLLTSSFSVLCFGSSFIGSGQLWLWLQNLVGVSNQVQYSCRPFSREAHCCHAVVPFPVHRFFLLMHVFFLWSVPVLVLAAWHAYRSRGCRSGLRRGVFVPRGRRKADRSRR